MVEVDTPNVLWLVLNVFEVLAAFYVLFHSTRQCMSAYMQSDDLAASSYALVSMIAVAVLCLSFMHALGYASRINHWL